MSSWVYTLENRIFTIVGHRTTKSIGTKYPDLFFTRDPEPDDVTNHFPTVYMNFRSTEAGNTLTNEEIEMVTSNLAVEITGGKSQGLNGTREVAFEVSEQLKKLGYSITMLPRVLITGNETTQYVLEATRLIGAGDNIG